MYGLNLPVSLPLIRLVHSGYSKLPEIFNFHTSQPPFVFDHNNQHYGGSGLFHGTMVPRLILVTANKLTANKSFSTTSMSLANIASYSRQQDEIPKGQEQPNQQNSNLL